MHGVVKYFLKSKGYGFITGEDGKEYFFHVNEVKNKFKEITDGLPARFEEAVSPKGYRALQVDIFDDDMPYEVPDYVIISKTGEVKGWSIAGRGKYSLGHESKDSPDDAREGLKKLAHRLGITGIINVRYFKTTGGRYQNYKYTIHNFEGQPVSLARKSLNGEYTTLDSISSFDNALEKHSITKRIKQKNIQLLQAIVVIAFILFFLICRLRFPNR